MRINLHIERLLLDGLPIERRQGPEIQEAIEMELTRLLAAQGFTADSFSSGSLQRVNVDGFQFSHGAEAGELGNQIAHSVHQGISVK